MDGVIADFKKGKESHPFSGQTPYMEGPNRPPGLYEIHPPIEGAIESVNKLLDVKQFDVYFLSTAPWDNPEAWIHKRLWTDKYFETRKIRKRLILSHHKQLRRRDYLIDDPFLLALAKGGFQVEALEHLHYPGGQFTNIENNESTTTFISHAVGLTQNIIIFKSNNFLC